MTIPAAPTPTPNALDGWVAVAGGYVRPALTGIVLVLAPEGGAWRAWVDSPHGVHAATPSPGALVDQAAAVAIYAVRDLIDEPWREQPASRFQIRGLSLIADGLGREAEREGWTRGRCADELATWRGRRLLRRLSALSGGAA